MGTIGVFLRSVDILEASQLSSSIAFNWLSFHASQKHITKLIKEIVANSSKPEPTAGAQSPEEFKREWNRLAMSLNTKLKH